MRVMVTQWVSVSNGHALPVLRKSSRWASSSFLTHLMLVLISVMKSKCAWRSSARFFSE